MKSDKELAVEIVIAAINAKLPKTNKNTEGAVQPLAIEDIAPLIAKVYETLSSLEDSDSET